ncbi:MAG: DUF4173 domain-containing protein [Anaerolineaceae bacterium]|nr:DUF4173 domain-containing protein [Anaerolineaceae bacterium]
MEFKYITRIGWTALVVAWFFDFLFWSKIPGISFFIFVIICLAAGGLLTWWEGLRPAKTSLVLVIPALYFAAMTFTHQEPFTRFVNFVLALGCLTLMVLTWRGGKWLNYSLSDYVVGAFKLLISAVSRGARIFYRPAQKIEISQSAIDQQPDPQASSASQDVLKPQIEKNTLKNPARSQVYAVIRGLLLAIPVVALLAALLSQADPIFSKELSSFLGTIFSDKLGEYIFRACYIVILAYVLIGIYLHALGQSKDEKLVGVEKPWLQPFLGWTEAVIVLGAVDVLFAFFVAVQFRYFFGGQINITVNGYTYADYARRGFGEMVAVAVISLMLFLGLSGITRRTQPLQRRVFSGLGVGLVVLVAVILLSAFQRLLLYETAYGFSRIRAYTHVFMIWVGLLLLAFVMLELLNRTRAFGLALALLVIGFGVSLNIVNVDGWIVTQNVARARQGDSFDQNYLLSLSSDSVPALFDQFHSANLNPSLKDGLGEVLACRLVWTPDNNPEAWQSFNLSTAQSAAFYQKYSGELKAYTMIPTNDGWSVKAAGAVIPCSTSNGTN